MGDGLPKDYKKKYQIGFMQGRLVNSEKKNVIQYFPAKTWKKEIKIAEKNQIYLMEWTINYENITNNFLVHKNINNNQIKFIKKSKVKIESVTCDFFMQKPYFKKKYYKFKKEVKQKITNLIINCEKIGIKFIILPLVDNSSINNLTELNNLVIEIKKFEIFLKKKMILFEVDFHPSKVIDFINFFNKKKYGINYDTGNSASLGYKINDEIKYFNYVKNIHIKDRIFNGASVRLGEGNFNFKLFFRLLNKSNYSGNLILQTARSKNENHIFELKKNFIFVKKFL